MSDNVIPPAGKARNAEIFANSLADHLGVFDQLQSLQADIERVAARLAKCLAGGNKIMLCGNGGSAADSQHIASELIGRFVNDRAPLAALALSTDSSALTSIGNDSGFEAVFERQVLGLGRAGDCLVLISTSGKSRNLLQAADAAARQGVIAIGLLGRDGGALRGRCDDAVVVPATTTARIQEAHIFIGHCWCEMLESSLGLGIASRGS